MPACAAVRLVVISSNGTRPSSHEAASRISPTVWLLRACSGVLRLAETVMVTRKTLRAKRECDSHSRPLILYYRGYARSRVADVDRRQLRSPAEAEGPEALSAGAHAGAAVSLQPGVRRLRKDPVSRPYSEAAVDARGVLPRGGRVRRADGGHLGRGTAAAPADRRDRDRKS